VDCFSAALWKSVCMYHSLNIMFRSSDIIRLLTVMPAFSSRLIARNPLTYTVIIIVIHFYLFQCAWTPFFPLASIYIFLSRLLQWQQSALLIVLFRSSDGLQNLANSSALLMCFDICWRLRLANRALWLLSHRTVNCGTCSESHSC
jgi:hypothetical protein